MIDDGEREREREIESDRDRGRGYVMNWDRKWWGTKEVIGDRAICSVIQRNMGSERERVGKSSRE